MKNLNDLKKLKAKIASNRDLMDLLWNQYGYTHKDILAVSIKLDRLINQYQRMLSQNQEEQLDISCSPNSLQASIF